MPRESIYNSRINYIPGTEFVDIYRGFDMIKKLSTELRNNCFEDIRIFPTNVELFLSAKAKK